MSRTPSEIVDDSVKLLSLYEAGKIPLGDVVIVLTSYIQDLAERLAALERRQS